MRNFEKIQLALFIVMFAGMLPLRAQSLYPGQQKEKMKVALKMPVKACPFELKDVKLLNSPFKLNEQRDEMVLRALNNDRLLLSFRVNAGMDLHGAEPLGGWESLNVELRGHTMGHVLSALALMYASTNDEFFKSKGDSLVKDLSEVQEVLHQGGYLSAFPQQLIDRVIFGKPVWAPWYTLHKILAGLLDQYLYADNLLALQVAEKMGDWAYDKIKNLSQGQLDTMMKNEYGGITETFYNLYALTGNKDYLSLAGKFYRHEMLDPLALGKDILPNHHANTYIPIIIAEVRGNELLKDSNKEKIAEFFWQTVIDHHTYATGGNSEREHFFERDSLSKHLTNVTTESCNTYNMLKLTNHLFAWTADSKYADYYERALYNHILATQDPETGMMCYFMPFKSGSFKVYSKPNSSFWCCVGTGYENHAKYGESIYFHNSNDVYVNLFIPSVLNWKEKRIKLRQETEYPESGKIKLNVESVNGKPFAIRLRYPSWATSGAQLKVNGKKISVNQKPGNYIVLNRIWESGDLIEVTFPMKLHFVPANDDSKLAVVAYGPIILAGEMGNEEMPQGAPYADNQTQFAKIDNPKDIVHAIITGNKLIDKCIKPVDNAEPLTFEFKNPSDTKPIRLIPYYRMHHQRYVIYWDIK